MTEAAYVALTLFVVLGIPLTLYALWLDRSETRRHRRIMDAYRHWLSPERRAQRMKERM